MNGVGGAGVVAGMLAALWAPAALFGWGPGAVVSADVGLALGDLAVVLGGVGLYLCHRGVATNRAACGWAVGLGVVFGALPVLIAVAAFAAPL